MFWNRSLHQKSVNDCFLFLFSAGIWRDIFTRMGFTKIVGSFLKSFVLLSTSIWIWNFKISSHQATGIEFHLILVNCWLLLKRITIKHPRKILILLKYDSNDYFPLCVLNQSTWLCTPSHIYYSRFGLKERFKLL